MVRITVIFLASLATARAQSDEIQITKVLTNQVQAWNNGNIDEYIIGYWNSDGTVFNSGGNLIRGYAQVLERYKKNYGTKDKMGKLEFEDLVIRKISPTAAVVMGTWKLHRTNDQPWGRFTLIVEKKSEGWRITHDHTSSADK